MPILYQPFIRPKKVAGWKCFENLIKFWTINKTIRFVLAPVFRQQYLHAAVCLVILEITWSAQLQKDYWSVCNSREKCCLFTRDSYLLWTLSANRQGLQCNTTCLRGSKLNTAAAHTASHTLCQVRNFISLTREITQKMSIFSTVPKKKMREKKIRGK